MYQEVITAKNLLLAGGPRRRLWTGAEGAKGGCGGKRGGVGGLAWRWAVFRQEKSLIHAIFYWNREILAEYI